MKALALFRGYPAVWCAAILGNYAPNQKKMQKLPAKT